MRSARLMAMVMSVRARQQVTAAQLADEFGVSVRTVYRDVSSLQQIGVPLWTESGPGGGIRLLPGWSELDALTGDEAAALSLAGVPSAVTELGLGAVALSAQLKVRSALPTELQARVERAERCFHLDAPGWFRPSEVVEHLGSVADAIWDQRRIDVRYRRGNRTVGRRLDPLGLVLKAGTWYLVARHRRTVRTYRVGRIERCVVLPDRFEHPPDFVLAEWWQESMQSFGAELERFRYSAAVAPGALSALPHVMDPAAARRALDGAVVREDGWSVLEVHSESEAVAASQLCGLGADVEVIEPAGLRRRLAEIGAQMAARHAGTGPPAR